MEESATPRPSKRGTVVAVAASVLLVCAALSPEGRTATTAPQTAQSGTATQSLDPIARRIKYLHDRLRITQNQETLWTKVAQAIRDNARDIEPLVRARLQTARTGNTREILQSYEALGEGQLANLRRFVAAFVPLYADLTPAQNTIADAIFHEGVLSTLTGGIPVLPPPVGLAPGAGLPAQGSLGAPLPPPPLNLPSATPSALPQPNLPPLGSQVVGPGGLVGTIINRTGNTATIAPPGGGGPGTYVPNSNGTATIVIPGQAPVVVPAR